MTPALKTKLLRLLQSDLGNAQDNAYRARLAFGRMTDQELDRKYGQSDRTCREIRDGCESWVAETTAAIAELETS